MFSKFLCTAALCALLVTCGNTAEGSLQLTLSDGSTTFTIFDGGPGDVLAGIPGTILWSNGFVFTMPGFTSLIVSSTSNAPGSPVSATLNTTQLDATSAVAKMLALTVLDNTFTSPGSPGNLLDVTNSLSGTLTSGSVTAIQATKLNAGSTSPASISMSVPGTTSANDTTFATLSRGAGATFTLQTNVNASFASRTSTSLTHASIATLPLGGPVVPEPTTLAIWTGMFSIGAIGFFGRRLRNA